MDYEEVFDELERLVEDIGYRVFENDTQNLDRGEEESEDEVTFWIIRASSGPGPDVAFVGDERESFVKVHSNYNFWADVAERLSDEQLNDLLEENTHEDVHEDHPVRELPVYWDELTGGEKRELLGAVEILSNLDNETYDDIIYQLTDILTTAEVKHVMDALDVENSIIGFQVYHKIFPQEENFDRYRLNQAIEKVRMSRHRGEIFLRYSFGMDVDRKDGSRTETSPEADSLGSSTKLP